MLLENATTLGTEAQIKKNLLTWQRNYTPGYTERQLETPGVLVPFPYVGGFEGKVL